MSMGLSLGLGLGARQQVGAPAFTPATLFANGEQGAWYDPSDLSTMFQDDAGTTPVTAAGQSGGRILDKSGRGNHATQANVAQRPLYQTSPARLTIDRIDDRLVVTVPAGGFVGTMVLATPEGTAAYGVNIPAGSFNIGGTGGSGVQFFPGTAIVGQIIRNGAMTQAQIDSAIDYLRQRGGGLNYGSVTNFTNFWRDQNRLTSFPLIDTSAGTNFNGAWFSCSSLTSFPLIDTSAGTNFANAWRGCSSLTSFPLIDTSAGTNFTSAWTDCSSLTSFPLIDTSAGTNFNSAWFSCLSLTSFPLIDTSAGTNFNSAWRNLFVLTSFPLLNVSNGTDFTSAWNNCFALTTFPANMFDGCAATNFTNAFTSTALNQTSIDGILVSINSNGTSNGTFNQSGGSAPSATGQAAITAMRSRGWTVTVTGGF